MTIMPSVSRILSTLRRVASGSNTGKGQGDAAICLLRVEHLRRYLLYAVSDFHQKCGRPHFSPPLTLGRPEQARQFEAVSDEGLTACFDDTGADKRVLFAELGMVHARPLVAR